LCVVTLALISPFVSLAQIRPVNDQGALGLAQLLRRLNTTASVMMIGAHPDDEDSALLGYLARGEHARTAYLSLTRGDGGQNIIGPELFEALGVIRTEELLQARRLDGAEQYFARAFDYGFSKTLAEAKSRWDEKIILCDTVRAIRLFRPMVVIARFSGTPADGHGQHQYAGYISPLAVKAAGDPGQCTTAGKPWRVIKFYRGQGFAPNATASLRLNTGEMDPLLGRSYFEIAMEGRSQHRSQGEGRTEFHGEQFSGLNLVTENAAPPVEEKRLLDGIDTTITGLRSVFNLDSSDGLDDVQKAVETSVKKYDAYRPQDIVKTLSMGAGATRRTIGSTKNDEVKFILAKKYEEFLAAIRLAAGLQIDALADKETVVPGESLVCNVKMYFPKTDLVTVKAININAPAGWTTVKVDAPRDNTPGYNKREVANSAAFFSVTVPRQEVVSEPYWLRDPRDGDLFNWPTGPEQTLPFQSPMVTAAVDVEIDGIPASFTEPVRFRFTEPARGEVRRELDVVPVLSIENDQDHLIVPISQKAQTRTLTVGITNNSVSPVSGVPGLNISGENEWKYTASSSSFSLKGRGDKTNVVFDITIPAGTKAGRYNISANALVGESVANRSMNAVAYPHIQTHRFYTRADVRIDVLDLKVEPVKVGYVMGSGDQVNESIRQMGLSVTMLEEKQLASADLSGFDSIVVGIRASETRPDFVANNTRLLEYVKNGGNLIIQYQRPSFAELNLLPFPATMGPRVVDENAPVTILQPEHPIFNFPNKITDADFTGWVQERNLYNFNTFDASYVPLLESHDGNEPENKGGLVIAKVGKGNYLYCSYSFFRQLPAGVSGAYRLLANMLSLPRIGR
ncbi:MAG: PIG-L family deacetylase, partial [Pyrinomonadaceae bacterium]